MDAYELQLKYRDEAVKKYQHLPLEEFIKAVFIECNYDLNRLYNVYINEFIEAPNVWGCFKQNEKYVTYFTNDRAEVQYKVYDDPIDFMDVFITNSTFYNKYDDFSNHNKSL